MKTRLLGHSGRLPHPSPRRPRDFPSTVTPRSERNAYAARVTHAFNLGASYYGNSAASVEIRKAESFPNLSMIHPATFDSFSPIVSRHQDPLLTIHNDESPDLFVALHADFPRIVSLVAGEHHNCPVDPSSTARSGCLSFALALVSASSSSSSSSTIVPRITVAGASCQKSETRQVSHRFLSSGLLFL